MYKRTAMKLENVRMNWKKKMYMK